MCHTLEGNGKLAAFRWHRKRETYYLALWREFNALDFFQHLDPTLHQRGLVGVVTKLVNECFEPGNLFVLASLGFSQSGNAFVPCGQVT